MAISIYGYLDDQGRETGFFPPGTTTDDTSPLLLGALTSYSPGNIVLIIRSDGVMGIATVSPGTGGFATWFYQDSALTNGHTYTYTAFALNLTASTVETSSSFAITVGSPALTITLQAWDDAGAVTGQIVNGGTTDDDTPTLKGALSSELAAGQMVNVYRDGVVIGVATVAGTHWEFQDSGLVNGTTYGYTAKVVDATGNVGAESDRVSFTFDNGTATLPSTTLQVWDDAGPVTGWVIDGDTTNDSTPTLMGTLSAPLAAGQSVHVYRNGTDLGAADVSGTHWELEDVGLVIGTAYRYTAKVVDQAGHSGTESASVTLTYYSHAEGDGSIQIARIMDDVGPVTGAIPNNGTTDDATPALQGTLMMPLSPGQSVHVLRDGVEIGMADVAGTNWQYTDSGLISGTTYSYTAQVVDQAGAVLLESSRWTFTFVDGSSANLPTLTLEVWDYTLPVIGQVLDGGTTNDSTPTLRGELSAPLAAGQSVHVYRDGMDLGAMNVTGTDWSYEDAGLVLGGTYTYIAKVVDQAGHFGASSNSMTFTFYNEGDGMIITQVIDDQMPVTGIVLNNGYTNDTTPQLSGVLSSPLYADQTLEIWRNDVKIGTVGVTGTSWTYQDSGLTDGKYAYTARVVDGAGVLQLVTAPWVIHVDTVAPQATARISSIQDDTGASATDFITADNTLLVSATVTGTVGANEKVQISLDNGATWHNAWLNGAGYQYDARGTPLADGTYIFQARVADAAGNLGTVSSQTVTIDTTKTGSPVIEHGIGANAHDVAIGTMGNDHIGIVSTHFTSINGGAGWDTLVFEQSGLTLNLAGTQVQGFEQFDLNNQSNSGAPLSSGNTLVLRLADVLNQPSPSQPMSILGDASSTVQLTDHANWAKSGTQAVGGVTFDVWHNATQGASTVADLLIEQGVHVI